jgi:ribosomal protein S6--L-glutamate ligase
MKIAIFSRQSQVYSTQRLLEELRARNHQAFVLDPDTSNLFSQPFDLLIPRLGTWKFHEALEKLTLIENRKMAVLNPSHALKDARDKWMSFLYFSNENLPTPNTSLLQKKSLPHTFPYVVKQTEGMQGKEVHLISNTSDLLKLPNQKEWLMQDYISEAKGQDKRLFVVGKKVVGAILRQAKTGDFRSNLSLGGVGYSYSPTEEEIKIAVKASQAIGLQVSGVDLIQSHSGPLVMEVNGSPGLQGIEKATGLNIAAEIIKYCELL